MIFKQGPLKAKIIPFFITIFLYVAIVACFFSFLINYYQFEFPILLEIGAVSMIPILPMLFIELRNIEWYHIYKDHIEVRNVFGLKNTVYFKQVSFVEEVDISVSIGKQKTYYIFNDGRKNTRNLLGIYPFYNNKKINLRIYKTKEMEKFIKNTLRFKIV